MRATRPGYSLASLRFDRRTNEEVVTIRVSLYHGQEKVGTVTYHSLLLLRPGETTCDPVGILDTEQMKALALKLMHRPLVRQGVLDKYEWREEC
jgi:hypothetical protein